MISENVHWLLLEVAISSPRCHLQPYTGDPLYIPHNTSSIPAAPVGEPVVEFDFESDEPLPLCPMRKDGSGADEVCDACQ